MSTPRRWLNGLALAAIVLAGSFLSNASAGTPPPKFPQEFRIGYQKPSTLFILKLRGALEKRLAPLGING